MNDPEQAREMQVAKTATYRAKRREAQVNKKDAAMAALGPAAEAALGAIESDRLANKTNEELAQAIRDYGPIVHNGVNLLDELVRRANGAKP